MRTLTYQILFENRSNNTRTLDQIIARNREIKTTLQEIRGSSAAAFNQLERDYQAATGSTRTLQERLNLLEAEYRENTLRIREFNAALNAQNLRSGDIDVLRGRLVQLQREYRRLGPEASTAVGARLRLEIKETTTEINRLADASGQAGKRVSTLGQTLSREFNQLGQRLLGVFAIDRIVTASVAGIQQIIEAGAQFESEISKVDAILRLTATGATEALSALEEQAKQLGVTTSFTATQAAEAQATLAQAGFNSAEITQSVEGVIRLAETGSLDLGQAAQIAANSLRAYNLAATELGFVNDVLAGSFTSANLNIVDFNEAFKLVAPLANTLNVEFEELAALVNTLADAGFRGSIGGTALRGALTFLVKPSQQAKDVLEELNISLVDQNGATRDVITVLGDLADANASTEQLARIFGKQVSAVSVLLNRGEEDLRLYAARLGRIGVVFTEVQANLGLTQDQFADFNSTFNSVNTELRDAGADFQVSAEDFASAFIAIGQGADSFADAQQTTANLLSRLFAPATEEARDAIQSLGFDLTDSLGNLREFDEIVNDFNRTGTDAATIQAIFGTETARFNELLALENGQLTALRENLEEVSLAEDIASERLNNLQGAFVRLSSATEGLRIAVFNAFTSGDSQTTGFRGAIETLGEFARALSAVIEGVDEGSDKFAELAAANEQGADSFREAFQTAQTLASVLGFVVDAFQVLVPAVIAYTVQARISAAASNLQGNALAIVSTRSAAAARATQVYGTALLGQTAIQRTFNAGVIAGRNALQALRAAALTNPFGIILTALSALVPLFLQFTDGVEESTGALESNGSILTDYERINSSFQNSIKGVIQDFRDEAVAVFQAQNALQASDLTVEDSTRLRNQLGKALQDLGVANDEVRRILSQENITREDLIDTIVRTLTVRAQEQALQELIAKGIDTTIAAERNLQEAADETIASLRGQIEFNDQLAESTTISAGVIAQYRSQATALREQLDELTSVQNQYTSGVEGAGSRLAELTGISETYNASVAEGEKNIDAFNRAQGNIEPIIRRAAEAIAENSDRLKQSNETLAENLTGSGSTDDEEAEIEKRLDRLTNTYLKAVENERRARQDIDIAALNAEEQRQLENARAETDILVAAERLNTDQQALALANIRREFADRRAEIFQEDTDNLRDVLQRRAQEANNVIQNAANSLDNIFDLEREQLQAEALAQIAFINASSLNAEDAAAQIADIQQDLTERLIQLQQERLQALELSLDLEVQAVVGSYNIRAAELDAAALEENADLVQINQDRVQLTQQVFADINAIVSDSVQNSVLSNQVQEQRATLDQVLVESQRAFAQQEIDKETFVDTIVEAERAFQTELINIQTESNTTQRNILLDSLDRRLEDYRRNALEICDSEEDFNEDLIRLAQQRVQIQRDVQQQLESLNILENTAGISDEELRELENRLNQRQASIAASRAQDEISQREFLDRSAQIQSEGFAEIFETQATTLALLYPEGEFEQALQRQQAFIEQSISNVQVGNRTLADLQTEFNQIRLDAQQLFEEQILSTVIDVSARGDDFREEIQELGAELAQEINNIDVGEGNAATIGLRLLDDFDEESEQLRQRIANELSLTQGEIQQLELDLLQRRFQALNRLREREIINEQEFQEERARISQQLLNVPSAGTFQTDAELNEQTQLLRDEYEIRRQDVIDNGAAQQRSQQQINAALVALEEELSDDIRNLTQRRLAGIVGDLESNNNAIAAVYRASTQQTQAILNEDQTNTEEYYKALEQDASNFVDALAIQQQRQLTQLDSFFNNQNTQAIQNTERNLDSQRQLLQSGQITQEQFLNTQAALLDTQNQTLVQNIEDRAEQARAVIEGTRRIILLEIQRLQDSLDGLDPTSAAAQGVQAQIGQLEASLAGLQGASIRTFSDAADAQVAVLDRSINQQIIALNEARLAGEISQQEYEDRLSDITADGEVDRLAIRLEGLRDQLATLDPTTDEYLRISNQILDIQRRQTSEEIKVRADAEAAKRAEIAKTRDAVAEQFQTISGAIQDVVGDQADAIGRRIEAIERAADTARQPLERRIDLLKEERDLAIRQIEDSGVSEEIARRQIEAIKDQADREIEETERRVSAIDRREEDATRAQEERRERILLLEERIESFRQIVSSANQIRLAIEGALEAQLQAQKSAGAAADASRSAQSIARDGTEIASKGTKAVVEAGSIPFPASLIAIGSIIAALASGFIAVRNLVRTNRQTPQFEAGGKIREGDNISQGGMIFGLRHSQGGVNLEAEGGEFVVNRPATDAFEPLLQWMNNEGRKAQKGGQMNLNIPPEAMSGKGFKANIQTSPSNTIANLAKAQEGGRIITTGQSSTSNQEVINALKEVRDAVTDIQVSFNINELEDAQRKKARADSRASS